MAKNIVICSDGTGNTAVKDRGSNVFKLYEAVDARPGSGQVAIYDDGVGTHGPRPLVLLGGIFGLGLAANVRELYAALVRCYEPGDRIFLFGFSRGAFTVRTLAGFIATCGVLDPRKFGPRDTLDERVRDAYEHYRLKYWDRHAGLNLKPGYYRKRRAHGGGKGWVRTAVGAFRATYGVSDPVHAPGGAVPIHFLGVWDTVAAYGFPITGWADWWNKLVYPFKFVDRSPNALVQCARHALSIDDERFTFHPMVWDETGSAPGRIEQVWFAGVHSNVGGGYPKHGMSLVALDWMMEEASQKGLRFHAEDRDYVRTHAHVHDKLYDSRAGLAVAYRYRPRDIRKFMAPGMRPKVHVSVLDRIVQGTDGYAPLALPHDFEVVGTQGSPRNLGPINATVVAAAASAVYDKASKAVSAGRRAYRLMLLFTVGAFGLMVQQVGWQAVLDVFLADNSGEALGQIVGAMPRASVAALLALVVGGLVCAGLGRKARGAVLRVTRGHWQPVVQAVRVHL